MLKEHERAYILNFPVLPDRFRPAAKRVFYSLLTADPPDGEDQISLHSIRSYFGDLKALILWLDKRWPPDRVTLSEVTPRDLEDYSRHLLATYPASTSARVRHRRAIRILWRWRTRLGSEALRFDPLRLDGWSESKSEKRAENATDRMPEQVLGPLLGWASRFVDEFSADILRAEHCWRQMRLHKVTRKRRKGAIQARLRQMLDEHLAQERPLPGYYGRPNVEHIARTLGCGRKSIDRYADMIEAAAAVVGIAPFSYFDTEITARLDGAPWIDGIATFHLANTSLAHLARHLQAACYIVIAFLSGMRDSENGAELHLMQHSAGSKYA
ncbi:site-specific integrase [Streptomyces sp. NL15-2K]|uniref:site-specific integrase n=1 Tax=Streptomyces sp. NL15-2K TaxID=376149 RepID=UPI000F5815BB|nr:MULTISPECIES: site-specific integrase [Actinomycetes]WKX07424.1 site-specific integrase [Kutzneria buriramensis]GCB51342.1 tiorf83 protein [Streptomyces sp. NL15-2K]